MATVDTDNIPEMTFDVSKLSSTTTSPPPDLSRDQSTNHSKENGFHIVLETAEYEDHEGQRSKERLSHEPVKQSNGHTNGHSVNQQQRSESADEDLEPKEHSASNQHNIQFKKHTRNESNDQSSQSKDNERHSQPSRKSSESRDNQSSNPPSRKSSEPANDIEAAKAKAHAERVARKAAKEARKAQKKASKDDSSLSQPRPSRTTFIPASAPNSPVDYQQSSPAARKLSDRSVSKHKLLAPPPIQSLRNNVISQPSSPMTPASPYVPPNHPKRKNQPHPNTSEHIIFGWDWYNVIDRSLEIVFGKNMTDLRSIAPKTLIRHPYVLAGTFATIMLMFVMKALNIRLRAPVFALFSVIGWLVHHSYISLSVITLVAVTLGWKNRSSLLKIYQAVFLPPLSDSFPDCFEYEAIKLADQPRELIAKWAKEIDEHTPVEDIVNQSNNRVEPLTPSMTHSPNAESRDTLPQMYSRISGTAALSLMQCYQQGELEDCEFHCLRVYSKDAKFLSNSVKDSKNNNIQADSDDTMGFVFLSIKKHYDVSPTLLKIFTPIQACFPWLCLPALWSQRIRRMMTFRFGVIGFHWPFRGAVFFTKPVADFKSALELDTNSIAHLADAQQANEQNESMIIQVARTAAFIAIAKQFDASRPAAERCDFLLYTCATVSPVVNAISASGGAPLPILPTYVADLRSVKGQDWQAYKRLLRHQNRKVREGPFENAGGHTDVVKGQDMNDEDADTLVTMWHKVAGFRTSRDATSCLMAPTVKFIHELTHHESGFVDFLALKLNHTIVAASMLFSLGPEVLTSDVAGFNYDALEEAGRKANQQIKAYPVKLAAVIKHGIANGYEYVDFGPTTGPSKMELGCKEINLVGGLYYHGTITSIVVSLAACAATSRHTVASR